MWFDLLRLASIGQRMELYGGINQQAALALHKQLSSHHQTQTQNHPFDGLSQLEQQHPLTDRAPINANQTGPLDLSVKGGSGSLGRYAENSHSFEANIEDSKHQTTNKTKRDPNNNSTTTTPNLASKLISSSTSPPASSLTLSSGGSSSASSWASASPVEVRELISSSEQLVSGSHDSTSSSSVAAHKRAPAAAGASSLLSRRPRVGKTLKSHLCNQCGRSFSRSDMLTRHSRLHSGLKPYQCSKCKQVFSRSDHLSTHERTHTGEKPYQCQHCSYSACRRDMITRHMRTHADQAGQRSRSPKMRHLQTTQRTGASGTQFTVSQMDVETSSLSSASSLNLGDSHPGNLV